MLSGKKKKNRSQKRQKTTLFHTYNILEKANFRSRYQIRLPEFGTWVVFRLKGADVNFGGDEAEQLFYILIEMVVTQLCGFFKTHRTLHRKVHFIGKCYLYE